MAFAARAAGLIAETTNPPSNGAKIAIARRTAAGSVDTSGLTPGVIVGVAIGGAGFLLLAGLVIIMPILYFRHLKKVEQRNRSTFADEARNPNESLVITEPPAAILRRNLHLPHSAEASWGLLSSQEDVSANAPVIKGRSQKRKSEGLSWPLSRKTSRKRRMMSRTFRRSTLTSIPESPSTGHVLENLSTIIGEADPVELSSDHQPGPSSKERGNSIFSLSSLIPIPDFSHTEGETCSRPARSISVSEPTIASNPPNQDRPALSARGSFADRTSKAISIEGQISAPPKDPPPPLPSQLEHSNTSTTVVPIVHRSSNSVSSLESMATSILNSPSKDRVSKQWSSAGTDPHLEERDDKIENGMMAGPRVRPQFSNCPRFLSSVASLRSTSTTNSYELRQYSESDRNSIVGNTTRFSTGYLEIAEAVNFSRPTSSASQKDLGIRSDQSPKQASQIRKVRSADQFGSPIARHPDSTSKGCLRKEQSQPSLQTIHTNESTSNLLQQPIPTVVSGPSFKSSPSPSPRKKHMRRKSIRDSVQLAHARSLSRSASSSRMDLIAEEASEAKQSSKTRGAAATLQQPERSSFAPQLKNPSFYRASLATRSADLSLVDYNEFMAAYGIGSLTPSPKRKNSRRNSCKSPIYDQTSSSTSKNPVNVERKQAESRETYSPDDTGLRMVPLSPSNSTSIPGLTLLHQNEPSHTSSPATEAVTWRSSPPLPRSLSPAPKSKATTELSGDVSPVMERTQRLQEALNPMENKPDFGPPKETMLPTPESAPFRERFRAPAPTVLSSATALRRMNRDGRGSEDWRSEPSSEPQPPMRKFVGALHSEDEFGDEEKENEDSRRGGGVWHGLDDLEDFWGTSQPHRREIIFGNSISQKSTSRGNKRVAWGPIEEIQKTHSVNSEGEISFGEEDFF